MLALAMRLGCMLPEGVFEDLAFIRHAVYFSLTRCVNVWVYG